ncbi:DUF2505 domain-containing protein [Demequina sp. NBRC 110056]|uniref:DUF2505 domain-containing protein n=1 Tax=Demequina sp. NBRC 110056 TaxID=1570345 RepID=UPI0009FC993A|nr:DUF2505 domain-containing protein [Demequina sp. NBRC 110056]
MNISHSHVFAATTDEVSTMLADRTFAERRGAASGSGSPDVQVEGTVAEGFSVTIRQQVPSSSIPAEFRSFVGSSLAVRYTEVWEPAVGPDRTGTFAVEIVGAPGHAAGSLALVPDGDGTRFVAAGAISVRVPLVGAMIESAVGDAVVKGLEAELAVADAWLAGDR